MKWQAIIFGLAGREDCDVSREFLLRMRLESVDQGDGRMRCSRFTEEQIIGVLREHDAEMETAGVCCKHGISEATFYNYKAKYGGMDVSDARRLRGLEVENAKLKRLLAEVMLDNAVLKGIAARKF